MVDGNPELYDFPDALYELNNGARIARQGWNGKAMSLYRLPRINVTIPGASVQTTLEPCIVLITPQGAHQPGWNASQQDMQAEDWVIITDAPDTV